jgi:hypothetical protein
MKSGRSMVEIVSYSSLANGCVDCAMGREIYSIHGE